MRQESTERRPPGLLIRERTQLSHLHARRKTTARGEFTCTSFPAGSLSLRTLNSDGGSPTTLSCPPAPRPPRRPSVPSPVVPAQCREARRRPSGASPAAGPSPRSRCRVIVSTVPRRPLQAGTSSAATLRVPAREESGQASASAQGAKAHRGETLNSLHG